MRTVVVVAVLVVMAVVVVVVVAVEEVVGFVVAVNRQEQALETAVGFSVQTEVYVALLGGLIVSCCE